MGADLILAWAEWPKNTQGYYLDGSHKSVQDFLANRLEKLSDETLFHFLTITQGEELSDVSELDNLTHEDGETWRELAQESLKYAIKEVYPTDNDGENSWRRDTITYARMGDTIFLVAGGTSWGDPTDGYECVSSLLATGILKNKEDGPGFPSG